MRWSILAMVAAAVGCVVGPEYKKPPVEVPAAFKEQVPAGAEAAAAPEKWKAAQPKDDVLRGKWWEVFGDRDLDALEEQVAPSNQNIAQAEAQFRGARAAVGVARSGLLPTATVGASVTRSHAPASRSSVVGSGTRTGDATAYQLPIDLSYEADVWGRVRRGLESSVAAAQASAADLATVRLSMQSELALDYFQLHGLDAQRQLLDATVKAYQEALQLTVNRFQQGIVSGVDVAQAQTQLETTRAESTDLSVLRAQLEHAIAILIGKPPAGFAIPQTPIGVVPPGIPVALPSELVERRSDVAAAERRMASANAQIGVAEAAFFPTLSLTASGGLESSALASLFSLPSRFWSIGPALVATVFDGGRRRATTEQAQASYDAAVAVYREDVLTSFQEVEDNLAALRILEQEASEQAAAVTASEHALQLAKNRYAGGITTYLEVITSQNIALADERTAVDILTRRMTASVNLIKALGGGWSASDLPAAATLVVR